jgi:hypothetical protein
MKAGLRMDEEEGEVEALTKGGREASYKNMGRRRCGQWVSRVAPPDQPCIADELPGGKNHNQNQNHGLLDHCMGGWPIRERTGE